jgi:CheY-like chemotaxis protein
MTSRSARILVVDDDPISRILARTQLERDGHCVSEAEDGIQALEAVMAATPDLVLLDVEMPRLDGYGTCEGLRALESLAHIPIVMMTGAQDDEAIERAYRSGATDFVVKPVRWPIIKNRVRYLLRSGEMVAELDENRRMHRGCAEDGITG